MMARLVTCTWELLKGIFLQTLGSAIRPQARLAPILRVWRVSPEWWMVKQSRLHFSTFPELIDRTRRFLPGKPSQSPAKLVSGFTGIRCRTCIARTGLRWRAA